MPVFRPYDELDSKASAGRARPQGVLIPSAKKLRCLDIEVALNETLLPVRAAGGYSWKLLRATLNDDTY
jgi:hypothetical protein